MASRSPEKICISVSAAMPARHQAKHTVPTGLPGEPPVGPAMPVIQAKKPPKILYATQVSTTPFKLLLFVNHVDLFKKPLLSFIKSRIIEEFQLNGVQVELEIRSDRKKEKEYRE
jgi:hypothetical protein